MGAGTTGFTFALPFLPLFSLLSSTLGRLGLLPGFAFVRFFAAPGLLCSVHFLGTSCGAGTLGFSTWVW